MALDGIKCPYYEYFRRCHSELNPRKKLSESCKGSDMPDYRNCPFFGSGQILQSNIGKYCGFPLLISIV